MFSTELGYTLEAAYREAAQRGHAFFCLEHLLFALLFDEQISTVLKRCGGNLPELKKELESFFEKHMEVVGPSSDKDEIQPIQTPAVQRVLQRAIMQMHSAGKNLVTAQDVLVSLYSEKDSHAAYFLHKQGIERLDIVNYVSHGVTKDGLGPLFDSEQGEEEERDEEGEAESRSKRPGALARFTENLTELAKEGKLDPVIGRELEIERAIKILSRRQKNNPLFLGDPGVGKTALASALAQRVVSGDVPDSLKDSSVYSLNIGSLIAGTKFRGEFEDRLKALIKELSTQAHPVLFIDEIHTIVGAGATGTGSMDAANLLKPALASGDFRCVGSTTHEDYKKSFEKDRALSRRFSNIDISEPTIEETVKILKGLKGRFEQHHKVTYSEAALRAAAELSAKHINDRFLPDKAIDVVDEAGAANMMLPLKKRKKVIGDKEIEKVVALIAKVPIKSVSQDDQTNLLNLEPSIKHLIFGQDEAVSAVCQAIKRNRAGLKRDNKPVGCFLFAGPTGVGKTELARVLSKELGVAFHRFDMSEYMEKHTVSRLVGAPPGYVGYEEGGILTDLVRKQPYAVLLLDEIEKAHEDLFNILLQVMDNASLTDSHGKKADCRNIILIMTTNAGSEKAAAIGFGDKKIISNREEAIKRLFKPEFRNRLDDVIHFNPLTRTDIGRIVDKFIIELEEQLSAKKITFDLSPAARDWLAENGFDVVLGARPMARLIQKEVKDPLTDEILFGKLIKGGRVNISTNKDKLELTIDSGS